jgi:hypothetical protein
MLRLIGHTTPNLRPGEEYLDLIEELRKALVISKIYI